MKNGQSIPVTREEITEFQHSGAVCLRKAFDLSWLDKLAAGIEQNLAAPSPNGEFLGGEDGRGRFFNDYCNWQNIPEFHDFIYSSRAAEIVARLMGSDQAIFYHEHILIKEPGNPKKTPWHHDQPYYPVDGSHMCSLWLPLDPVPLETSLQFVKGSHAWDRMFVPRKFATASNYEFKDDIDDVITFESVPDIEGQPEQYEILSWALEPGDCLVFYGLTLHGAAGNASLTTSRRAFSARWFGDDARFVERPWEISPPITGGLAPGDAMVCDTFPDLASYTEISLKTELYRILTCHARMYLEAKRRYRASRKAIIVDSRQACPRPHLREDKLRRGNMRE